MPITTGSALRAKQRPNWPKPQKRRSIESKRRPFSRKPGDGFLAHLRIAGALPRARLYVDFVSARAVPRAILTSTRTRSGAHGFCIGRPKSLRRFASERLGERPEYQQFPPRQRP